MKKVVVVGGGTAGWLAANILASSLNRVHQHVEITLIESERIGTIGVGEGTFPTMRQTLERIGIHEDDFINFTDATFKQAIKFDNWLHDPKTSPHSYFHLFERPLSINGDDLSQAWLSSFKNEPFAPFVSFQNTVCEQHLSPKKLTQAQYKGTLNYAYHVNAKKFAELLSQHGQNNHNVQQIIDDVIDVNLSENGSISSLKTRSNGTISADFFVDCSGFSSLLLGQSLKVPFVDKNDVLFVDHAVTMQVPYQNKEKELPPYTITTAQECGWIWDIALQTRKGVGYVYSSQHTTHQRAEQVLREYVGKEGQDLEVRKIPMRVGHRERFWEKNCVAIGLSSGFIEPLESTAIVMIEAAAQMLADKFPLDMENMREVSNQYNEHFTYRWERIIDFVKLHYCISQRDDNSFWQDNRLPSSIPESLQKKMEQWRYMPPSDYDFPSMFETFTLGSYQYVLYGMEYNTQTERKSDITENQIKKYTKDLEFYRNKLTQELPGHRDFLNRVKKYGLKKV